MYLHINYHAQQVSKYNKPYDLPLYYELKCISSHPQLVQSDGVVEYTDCTSTELLDPTPNECPGYHSKQTDSKL